MALATRCPHCGTIFRVAQDQLKLRSGLVRCGACQQIFNGVEALVDEAALAASVQAAPAASSPPVSSSPDSSLPVSAPGRADAAVLAAAAWSAALHESGPDVPEPPAAPDPVPAAAAAPAVLPALPPIPTPELEPDPDPEPTLTLNFDIDFESESAPAAATAPPAPAPVPAAEPAVAALAEALSDFPPAPIAHDVAPAALPPVVVAEDDDDDAYQVSLSSAPPANAGQRLKAMLGRSRPAASPSAPPLPAVPSAASSAVPSERSAAALAPEQAIAADVFKGMEEDISNIADVFDDEPEPTFVARTRRQGMQARRWRYLYLAGALLLLLALPLQLGYILRDRIAASWPQTRPALVQACSALGCKIGLPAQIDQVSLESQELQTLANQSLMLTSLLRNRSTTVQRWPDMELTLLDSADKPIARRVFAPADYLPGSAVAGKSDPAAGMAARSETAVKLYFELAQAHPASYRVYIFYR